jgi:hypothetical protein
MTNPICAPSLDPRLKAFLRAPVDENQAGEPLSVVSALARLDIDPWGEAAELSRLSRQAALQRLAGHLAKVARRPAAHAATGHAAERLIALLPRGLESEVMARATAPGGRESVGSSDVMFICLIASAIAVMTWSFMTARRAPDQPVPGPSVAAADSPPVAAPTAFKGDARPIP